MDHLAWNLSYSKDRIDALIQALMKLEPEPSRGPQLQCMDDLAMRVWGYVITPHEAIPYRGVMRRDRQSKSIACMMSTNRLENIELQSVTDIHDVGQA